VVVIGDPSYTSGLQTWKGTTVNLKKKPKIMDKKPRIIVGEVVVDRLTNNFVRSVKFVDPLKPYINDIPKRRILEENAPRMKYFKPASTENWEVLLKAARI
jgi:hypothetical protein